MGLAEKRAMQNFQENVYPGILSDLNATAKFDLTIEIDWDSLALEGDSGLYDERWPMIYFTPLKEALSSICADEMGTNALKETLKKIEIKNTDGNYDSHKIAKFDGGVLTLDHCPKSNYLHGNARTSNIRETLESKL